MQNEFTMKVVEKEFTTKDTNEKKKYKAFVTTIDGEEFEFVPKYKDDKAVIKHYLRKSS